MYTILVTIWITSSVDRPFLLPIWPSVSGAELLSRDYADSLQGGIADYVDLLQTCHRLRGLAAECHRLRGLAAECHRLRGLAAECHRLRGLAAELRGLAAEFTWTRCIGSKTIEYSWPGLIKDLLS
jgi:hypothetical protein